MCFYFVARDGTTVLFMGRDKHENENLIRYGTECDVWFHVSAMSSAHVYIRLTPDPETGAVPDLSEVDQGVLDDCAQLVKANSIKGNKEDNVKIVYTKWENLKKRKSMEVGQIGFHSEKANHYMTVRSRENAIVNRLNKTKTCVEEPDFAGEQAAYEREKRRRARGVQKVREDKDKAAIKAKQQQREEDDVFAGECAAVGGMSLGGADLDDVLDEWGGDDDGGGGGDDDFF